MINDMKKVSLRFAALMAAMMMTVMTFAETQDWGGRVIDEKGEPMPFVNVVLLSLPDSAFVQGAMTDMDGVFKIVTDINQGLFKVTSVGYQTLYIGRSGLDYPDEGGHATAQRSCSKRSAAQDACQR